MAALREVPFGLYYGSVDSTPLFVLLAGLYLERTGDIETIADLWPAIRPPWTGSTVPAIRMATASWNTKERPTRVSPIKAGRIRKTQSFTPTGDWPKARSRSPKSRGTFTPPSALRRVARGALDATPRRSRSRPTRRYLPNASRRRSGARSLKRMRLALDGAKRPCAVRTSNAGQVLFTGIADPKRAALVASGLLRPDFFSGWGIRTVARGEARFNPMSYHNGSIWPHDNALIGLGLARYGFKQQLETLFTGLFYAGTYMEHRRLPELFCGFQRQSAMALRSIRSLAVRKLGLALRRLRCCRPPSACNLIRSPTKSG